MTTISVVIPAFNRESFIGTALESAIEQAEPADEVIVVDDGSTDRTREIALSYGKDVIVLSCQNNGAGPSRPRNIGIRAAKSSHIMFLDSDDRLERNAISRCKEIIRRYPDIGLVCGNYYMASEGDGRRVRNPATTVRNLPAQLVGPNEYWIEQRVAYNAYCRANYIKTNATTVAKAICVSLGGFDEALRTSNDYDFFIRVLAKYDMVYIDEPLHTIVHHMGNISAANRDGRFRDYVYINHVRVLMRQAALAKDSETAAIIRSSIRRWLLDLAYGYRANGDLWRAVLTYTKCVNVPRIVIGASDGD